MRDYYKIFIIAIDAHSSLGQDEYVYYVMKFLKELCEDKRFEDMQSVLDNVEPSWLGENAAYTVALVSWWYASNLDRKTYLEKAIKYYTEIKGAKKAEQLFKNILGEWKPTFGFERELFGISE